MLPHGTQTRTGVIQLGWDGEMEFRMMTSLTAVSRYGWWAPIYMDMLLPFGERLCCIGFCVLWLHKCIKTSWISSYMKNWYAGKDAGDKDPERNSINIWRQFQQKSHEVNRVQEHLTDQDSGPAVFVASLSDWLSLYDSSYQEPGVGLPSPPVVGKLTLQILKMITQLDWLKKKQE